MQHITALLGFIIFRVASIALVRTSFVPDEYWQSLEVAHRLVFGYGHLTWEWTEGIRSCVYPSFTAIIYRILKFFALDNPTTLILLPRILQAVVSGIGDYFTCRLSARLHGPTASRWTGFCILTSWFLFYTSTRTLTNTAEAAVSAIALYLYPWRLKRNSTLYLWFAALAFVVRPTAAIVWAPLYMWHLLKTSFKVTLLRRTLVVSLATVVVISVWDRWCFGHWLLTPYNFLYFNWSHDIGAFYGSHPWHWYISQGIPTVLSAHTLPFVMGLKHKCLYPIYGLIVWVVLVLSFLSHKEFRFLLPLLHPIMCICGFVLSSIETQKRTFLALVLLLVIANVPVALYFGCIHQRGTLEVMKYLTEAVDPQRQDSILFLMPCHSTPYSSHIHKNVSMRFLTCEPNLKGRLAHLDEADRFYADQSGWLARNVVGPLPSLVVTFDVLEKELGPFLSHYRLCHVTFHTHFPEGRVGKFVHVYCKSEHNKNTS